MRLFFTHLPVGSWKKHISFVQMLGPYWRPDTAQSTLTSYMGNMNASYYLPLQRWNLFHHGRIRLISRASSLARCQENIVRNMKVWCYFVVRRIFQCQRAEHGLQKYCTASDLHSGPPGRCQQPRHFIFAFFLMLHNAPLGGITRGDKGRPRMPLPTSKQITRVPAWVYYMGIYSYQLPESLTQRARIQACSIKQHIKTIRQGRINQY